MKRNLLLVLLIFLVSNLEAQRFNISYGGLLGVNSSFMNSRSLISDDFLASDPTFFRNISISTKAKTNIGFNAGLYLRVQPIKSRFRFETGLLIEKYNNSYSISVKYEHFFSTTGAATPGYWNFEEETERLSNEFSIIKIPLIIGYDLIKKDKYKFALLGGLSPNVNMTQGQIRYDNQNNEITLYKPFFISYHSGISMIFNKISCSLKYEHSFNIKKANSKYYIPSSSMKVEKLYLSSISILIGIKLN